MKNNFLLSINNQDGWKPTDSQGQHYLVESLIQECNKRDARKINTVTSGFMVNNAEAVKMGTNNQDA